MKTMFIINPHSGQGKGGKIGDKIKVFLKRHPGLDWAWVETAKAGDTVPLAQSAAKEGYELLVAVGGDGTINEVLNVAIQEGKILGVIPAGTGNDLARTLGIPLELEKALEYIRRGKIHLIDIGTINGRYFINAAGSGIDVQILQDVNGKTHFLKGSLAYLWAVLKNLLFFQPRTFLLQLDGETIEREAFLVVVANGRYFGGGMMVAPEADVTDGLFDVCVVKKMGKLFLLPAFFTVYNGTHLGNPNVEFYRASSVLLQAKDSKLEVQCDGEITGETPQQISCLQRKARIILG